MSVSTLGSTSTAAPRQGRASWPPSVHNTVFNLAANSNATFPFFCRRLQQQLAARLQGGHGHVYQPAAGRHVRPNDDHGPAPLAQHHGIGARTQLLPDGGEAATQTFVERYIKRYSLNEALIPHYPSDSGATRYLTERLQKELRNNCRMSNAAGSGTLITDDVSTDPQLATW